MLKGALGLGDDDISHFNGFGYARDTARRWRWSARASTTRRS